MDPYLRHSAIHGEHTAVWLAAKVPRVSAEAQPQAHLKAAEVAGLDVWN